MLYFVILRAVMEQVTSSNIMLIHFTWHFKAQMLPKSYESLAFELLKQGICKPLDWPQSISIQICIHLKCAESWNGRCTQCCETWTTIYFS